MVELMVADTQTLSFEDFVSELKTKVNKAILVRKQDDTLFDEIYTEGELLQVVSNKGSFTLTVDEDESPAERHYLSFLISHIEKVNKKYVVYFKQGYRLVFSFKRMDKSQDIKEKPTLYKTRENKEHKEILELKNTLENLGFTETRSFDSFALELSKAKENGFTDILTINKNAKKVDGLLDSVTLLEGEVLIHVYELGKGLKPVKFKKEDTMLVTEVKLENTVYFTVYGKGIVSPVILKTK
ncbi:hypothetical protein P9X10_00730 [Bacillus cereus]|nr:hypothetical protein [Bacillus cereus]